MKNLLLILFICLSAEYSFSQDTITHRPADPQREQKPPLKDRLFAGGDLGLQFGDITYVYLAPIIGYKITEKLSAGGGPSYSYFKERNFYGNNTDSYSFSSYGGRIFGQYRVIPQAVAYAEYSVINASVIDDISYKEKRVNIPSFLVGGGYSEPVGDRSYFTIMVLFDVAQDRYSYTQNPIIRAGFNIGL